METADGSQPGAGRASETVDRRGEPGMGGPYNTLREDSDPQRERGSLRMKATLQVTGLKVAVPLPAHTLPPDLVPPEGPAGAPVIELALEGSTLTALATINGKN